MTTSVSFGPTRVQLQGTITELRPAPGNIPDSAGLVYTGPNFVPGVGSGAVNQLYKLGQYSIAASGLLTVNLASLLDAFQNAIDFVRVKSLYVENSAAGNASSILAGAAGVFNPTVAPSLTQTASGGSLSNGTYLVAYTWITATGETKLSPTASIVVNGGGSSQIITIGTLTLPSGATGINVYTSLATTNKVVGLQGTQNAGTAYVIQTLAGTTSVAPPNVNTCYTTYSRLFADPGAQVRILNGCHFGLGDAADAVGYAASGSNTYLGIVNEDVVNAALVNLWAAGNNS